MIFICKFEDCSRMLNVYRNYLSYYFKLILNYLNLTLWVRLTAVITCKDSPLTCGSHVFLEVIPLHRHVAVFVRTNDNFENTTYQVSLLQKQFNIIPYFSLVLFHVFCKHADYLFVPKLSSPFTTFTWTFDGKRKNLPFCCFVRENILKNE